MDAYEFLDKMTAQAERFVMDMDRATAKELGLDPRSGYELFVSRDAIVVDKYSDRTLQYYGGFEYVNKDFRTEVGDYVFYTVETNENEDRVGRVGECIDRFYDKAKEDAEEIA